MCLPHVSHFKIKPGKVTLKHIIVIFRRSECTNICTTQTTSHVNNLHFLFSFFGYWRECYLPHCKGFGSLINDV